MPKEEEDRIEELDRRLGEVEARLAAVAGLRETYDARFTLLTEKAGGAEIHDHCSGEGKRGCESEGRKGVGIVGGDKAGRVQGLS
jgi:hypothetical protein